MLKCKGSLTPRHTSLKGRGPSRAILAPGLKSEQVWRQLNRLQRMSLCFPIMGGSSCPHTAERGHTQTSNPKASLGGIRNAPGPTT